MKPTTMKDSPAFDVKKFNVKKFDSILARGLSSGLGKTGQQVCIEAAICETLGMPHSDDPKCVSLAVRAFKIALNDRSWSSPAARAAGLRELGLAQLGSKDVVNDNEFLRRLSEKTIRVLIPTLFREIFTKPDLLEAATQCEREGTVEAIQNARKLAAAHDYAAAYAAAYASASASAFASSYDPTYAAAAADTAAYAAAYAAAASASASYATYAATATAAAAAARAAAADATTSDKYLKFSAKLALEVLRELKSPGIALL